MLVCVEMFLHIAHDPKNGMGQLNSIYQLKDGVGPPDRYLVANVGNFQIQDGSVAWSMTCMYYLKGSI